MQLTFFVATVLGVLVLAYRAFAGPSTAREGTRRLQAVRVRHSESAKDRVEAQLRRAVAARKPRVHSIAGANSRIEALMLRLDRTGRSWTVAQYLYVSLGIAVVMTMLIYYKSGALLLGLGLGMFAGAGLPHWVIGTMIKRRRNAFITRFPDAIELLVRGLRSGLPVTETISVVASEVPGPVGAEFKLVGERIKIGKQIDDALQDTADRLDAPEFNFFCIALAIQRETGGNLAETLSNLADMLRKRGQMKLKIRAMSSESKASAYIVGSLPFVVFGLVFWINPAYLGDFFTDDRLIIAGFGGLLWMAIGAFIMAKMVSFEI